MLAAWTYVRCQLLGRHRWQPIQDPNESGWRCSGCDELVLERYYIERDHDAHLKTVPTPIYTGALGGAPPPTG